EQGARPLRAIVDFDEALMYCRRGKRGDIESAQPLLDAALQQFHAVGMPGWIRRAEALRTSSLTDERTPSAPRGAESAKVAGTGARGGRWLRTRRSRRSRATRRPREPLPGCIAKGTTGPSSMPAPPLGCAT